MRVVFMGSPHFALPTLHVLARQHDLVAVVTQPDRPAGRGRKISPSPVKIAAGDLRIPILQPSKLRDPAFLAHIAQLAPDVIVVAAYGRILPPQVLDLPPCGCINVHASLLPRWRGAAPIQAAILHGDKHTGVTIMRMDAGLDTGPIIAQRPTSIPPDETGGGLSLRLANIGSDLIGEILVPYCAGDVPVVPQDDGQATHAPLLTKSDGLLDWRKPACYLQRQVQAFEPWPSSFLTWNDQRIVVRKAHGLSDVSAVPGQVFVFEGLPAVGTAAGALVLEIIQPAGRKAMHAGTFLRGAPAFSSARLPVAA